MARIIIENAEVTKVNRTGTGFRCQNVYKTRSGEEIAEKWVIWSDHPVQVGDVVNVEGLFSKKDESFQNDEGEQIKYIAFHVNKTTVTQQPKGPNNSDSSADSWLNNNALPIDEEAPF